MRIRRMSDGGWVIQTEREYRAQNRDTCARTLVGARIPRKTAEIVKKAAERSGRSVYRFTIDALRNEVEQVLGIGRFRMR